MLLALWAIILTAAAMIAWDWWTHRPHAADTGPYDWERDTVLARQLADDEQADDTWERYFDQHGVLVFPRP